MAKVKSGLFNKISGTVGNKTTFRTTNKIILQKKPIPTDRKTEKQLAQRLRYKQACQAWHQLTPEQKAQFEAIAKQKNITAFNAFLSYYLLQPPAPTEQVIFFDDFNEMPTRQVYDYYLSIDTGVYVQNSMLILPSNKYAVLDKSLTITPPFSIETKLLLEDPSTSHFFQTIYITTEEWDKYVGLIIWQGWDSGMLRPKIRLDIYGMPSEIYVEQVNFNYSTENTIKLIVSRNNAKITLNGTEILNVNGEFTNTISGYLDINLMNQPMSQYQLKLDYIKITKP